MKNKTKMRKLDARRLAKLQGYRTPKETVFIYTADHDDIDWWGCPRCHSVIEHDFQNYCGHCGQRVSWKKYAKLYSKNN